MPIKEEGRLLNFVKKDLGPDYYSYDNSNLEKAHVKGIIGWRNVSNRFK